MKLMTRELEKKLRANWRDKSGKRPPVLKIFSPAGAATWIIHSAEPQEPDRLFGLCDLGMGYPELGYVSLTELQELSVPVRIVGAVNGTMGVKLERDLYFRPQHSLRAYSDAASARGHITEMTRDLDTAAAQLGENPCRPDPERTPEVEAEHCPEPELEAVLETEPPPEPEQERKARVHKERATHDAEPIPAGELDTRTKPVQTAFNFG